MDVDEDPPGASLVSENQPNDASSVPSNEEPSNDVRAPIAASLNNKNGDDACVVLTWTGAGWHTVLSRRRKKKHKQSQKELEKGLEKKNEKSAAHPPVDAAVYSQVKREFQRRKRRGPTPLPKEDIKIILRPHKSLTTPPQRNISKPVEVPGKPNLKKTPSSSWETSSVHAREEEAAASTTGLSTECVQNNQPNKVSWASPVPPDVPVNDSPQYRKILEKNKRLTQEIKQLRNQMAAERKEYKLAISSIESKLGNAIKKIQNLGPVGNPTNGNKEARERLADMKDSPETSEETIDENSFATQSESSELIKQVQTQVQANRKSIATLHKLLADFMAEIKTFVVEELIIQRQYVNDAVGGLQTALNRRCLSAPVIEKPSNTGRDSMHTTMQHGQ
ncbi:hypothetical protein HPB51_022926 [Rhipicephalus microplus]|uniref:Uncharacterized protein n=1 Tax=Rhipicephalus microplus TaxID=6941 RepID=A0A9J6D820_RHIMP|nr:hypothetical protein HPB51_022926 [Rhipicephalus microplus]